MAKISTMAAALLIGATSAIIPALPASAAPVAPVDDFDICASDCSDVVIGEITWYNRTAVVTGTIYDSGPGSTTAFFEAYANETEVDTRGVTVNDESDLGSRRDFEITLGDPDFPGELNRIRITICDTDANYNMNCVPEVFTK